MNVELRPLEADLAVHQKLDDEPNDVGGLTAGELKAKFDEAGLTIQRYLNEELLPQVAQGFRDTLEEAQSYADGKVADIGAGDMAQAVYDPHKLRRDVYQYARDTAREAVGAARLFGCVAAGSCSGSVTGAGEAAVTLQDPADPRGLWSQEESAFVVPQGANAMLLTLSVKWGRESRSDCCAEVLVNGTVQKSVHGPDAGDGSYVWETLLFPVAVRGGDRVEVALRSTCPADQTAEAAAKYLKAEIMM